MFQNRFIGEETVADTKETPVLTDKPTWIIDPIDGTINYINGNPNTCISVALAICKELVIGIIYNPIVSELYTAIKGQGAFLNDKPIKTTCNTELKKSVIEVELFSLRNRSRNRDIRLGRFEAYVNITRGIRFLGSAAMGLAYVARGAVDCFQMDPLQSWDVAAGVLIVREAGGTVIDTKGALVGYTQCCLIFLTNNEVKISFEFLLIRYNFVTEDEYNVMKPRTIAAANETLAMEIKQLIVDTDLKTMRKRLTKT
ncbi:hypothetical protein E2986_07152 [Frieseomelitta varia]|uniref:Inositol-1-monophosphatase n=1 Tax=Frieseomelitta varia TaxID=561572 RepID=A0A833RI13_9HYME|nr:hypothetical protein E2986_07152 [Frieseomelitta varia]